MPKNYLIAYAAHPYEGKIYVFGGREEWGEYGRNIMMALDLETLQWEIISGTTEVKGDFTHPGPRGYACSWIVGDKFYVTLGSAKRVDMGPDADHTYFDLWSLDLKSHKWTSQKMQGNPPSPRTQAVYTYNQAWNKSIVFGGYHGDMMFMQPGDKEIKRFAYYADTFIWCPEVNRWSHVLTKGFPTYRSCAELFTDPSTGKTYLFGGLTNTQFVPSRKSTMVKILNDIWELVIDVPDSGFEQSDFEDPDPRFSKLGPWEGGWFALGRVVRRHKQRHSVAKIVK
ncbi:hypothetical protein FRC04_002472 [Tulasnella sp. 424]|nr:hypothetical protein FRC04_002472 [Tulasnella sp. 424]KAG8967578.1 hypothetical protein FRC05_002011 [Tulasnella sp. 425]